MKLSLSEISLKELREFIEKADNYSEIRLSELSLVSLKLRLQLLIKKHRLSGFGQFMRFYEDNVEFRNSIHDEIIPVPTELFRDADNWQILIDEINSRSKSGKLKIAICETGKWVDVISLIVLLINETNLTEYTIDVFALRKNYQTIFSTFNKKEIELGETNYAGFNFAKKLETYFEEKNKEYQFVMPSTINLRTIPSFETNLHAEETYDIVIGRNITIAYNFKTHEEIVNRIIALLNKNALWFAGNRESFKWCSNYHLLGSNNNKIPIYFKK